MKATIIKADGTSTEIEPKNGTDFSLNELQSIVGGYIEVCDTVSDDHILVIDEEGKLKGKPINDVATVAYKYAFSNGKLIDAIVGDALYCHRDMVR